MKLYIAYLFIMICTHLNAQYTSKSVLSKKAIEITIQGELLGRSRTPPPPVVEHFQGFENEISGVIYINKIPVPLTISILPTRCYNIAIHVNKNLTDWMRNNGNFYKFHLELFTQWHVRFEGDVIVDLTATLPDNSKPKTNFVLKNGIEIADPEELSIFLITTQIRNKLHSDTVGAKYSKDEQAEISNLFTEPAITPDNLERKSGNLAGLNNIHLKNLSDLFSLYNYCGYYISDSSFYAREAMLLNGKINVLTNKIQSASSFIAGLSDSTQADLLRKIEAYKSYLLTVSELTIIRQRIEAVIRHSYYNFTGQRYSDH